MFSHCGCSGEEDPKVNGELSYLRGWRHLKRREGNWVLPVDTEQEKRRERKELFNLRYNLGEKANTNNTTDKSGVETKRRFLIRD